MEFNLLDKEKEGLFKRYPYVSEWTKGLSKILFYMCISILIILWFQFSFTPISKNLQKREITQVPLEVTLLPAIEETKKNLDIKIVKEEVKDTSIRQVQAKGNLVFAKNNIRGSQSFSLEDSSEVIQQSINELPHRAGPVVAETPLEKSLEEPVKEAVGKYEGAVLDIEAFYSLLKKFNKSVKLALFANAQFNGGTAVDNLPSPYREMAIQDRIELSNKYSFITKKSPKEDKMLLEATAEDITREAESLGGWQNVEIRILLDRTDSYGRRMYIRFERKV